MPIARRWAVITLVAGSIVVAALAFWQLRTLLILLLVAFTLAAGMRAGVEALKRRGIPVWLGILLHYALLVGLVALLSAFVVPPALGELRTALGGLPPSPSYVHEKVRHANGVRREVLVALEHLLRQAPTRDELLHPAIVAGRRIGAILAGIVFTLAVAAYWLVERERSLAFVATLVPPGKRRSVFDAWLLVESRLGAYVRGVFTMVLLVSTILSTLYVLLGVPYALLLGPFSGVIEIVPIVGPLLAGGAAIGLALTVSWQLALETAAVFVGFRLIQDYLINPRVIGRAVGLPPLVVLVSASVVGVVLGPAAVALATPLAAISVTVVEVVLGLRRPSPPVVRAGGVSYDNAPTVREHS
jgi:predicted PurR-regulated permease PerM